MTETDHRIERDTLGEVRVPANAYYGAQTARALENFPVSGLRLQPEFVRAQALIKLAAARANTAAGRLDKPIGDALVKAAQEILDGAHMDQFVVDVFQAGAGTSQNMNVNEVLANRANEILGRPLGSGGPVHPNDHANMGQSTNDTIHTAIHIAALCLIHEALLPAIDGLAGELEAKAREFDHIVKSGRTHMQDAVPIRLGQEIGACATMLRLGRDRVARASEGLRELAIGGTAVGTGLNTHAGYKDYVIEVIREAAGLEFAKAADPFEAMQNFDAVVEVAGSLRTLVTSLRKIAADVRRPWMPLSSVARWAGASRLREHSSSSSTAYPCRPATAYSWGTILGGTSLGLRPSAWTPCY